MRLIRALFAATLVPFLIAGPFASANGEEVGDPTLSAPEEASQFDYGTCPSAEFICAYWHGGLAVPTNYCVGYDCFKKTYFEQAQVLAASNEGVFPKTFKAWLNDNAQALDTSWTGLPCDIELSGNKFLIKVPENSIRCSVGLMTPEAMYYWHAASNPETGCLGIGECKQTLIYETAELPPRE